MAKNTLRDFDFSQIDFQFDFAGAPDVSVSWTDAVNEVGAVHKINNQGIVGVALLTPSAMGARFVVRLKDTRPVLENEIRFWSESLASLVDASAFDFVTHAPSSGKTADGWHLATHMGRDVAAALGLPFVTAIVNNSPRGNRGSRHMKFYEQKDYEFVGKVGRYLVVDDVIFTRATAKACKRVIEDAGAAAFFAALYRA